MAYTLGKKVTDDGIWINYSGARLKVGRAGSTEFLKAQEDLERPYKKKIEKGTLSITVKRELNIRSLARTLLLDWEGVVDEDGKSVPYNEEVGVQALLDDPDMLELVMDTALDNENFRTQQVKKTVKKSPKSLTGT